MIRRVLDWWSGIQDFFIMLGLFTEWGCISKLCRLLPSHASTVDEETRTIAFTRRILSLRPILGFQRGTYLTTLSSTLYSRALRSKNAEDLGGAISVAHEAVPISTLGRTRQNIQLFHNLGLECLARYENNGPVADLGTCILFFTKALLLCPLEDTLQPIISINLMKAVHLRISFSDEPEDYDGYIDPGSLSLAQTEMTLAVIAAFLLWSFEKGGHVEELNLAVTYSRALITLLEASHAGAAPSGLDILSSSSQTSDVQDDVEHRRQETLITSPPDSPVDYPLCYGVVAFTLLANYNHSGDVHDLEQSYVFSTKALAICPPTHPTRSYLLNIHASLQISRFVYAGNETDFLFSIESGNEALALHPQGHLKRSWPLLNLASAKLAHYQPSVTPTDIESSIEHLREAIGLVPRRSVFYPVAHMLLATALVYRGHHDDTEEAMNLGQMVLILYPPGNAHRTEALCCMATLLSWRACTASRQQNDLILSQQYISEALSCCPTTAPIRVRLVGLLTLAASNSARSPHLLTLRRHWKILDHCPAGHLHRPYLLMGIVSFFDARYAKSRSVSDLVAWIKNIQASLDSLPRDSMHRLRLVSYLLEATGFLIHRTPSSQGEVMAQLVDLETRAMSLCPPTHINDARLMIAPTLARLLFHSFLRTRNADEGEKTIQYYREARSLCSADTPHQTRVTIMSGLAAALDEHFKDTGKMDDLQDSIELRRDALSLYDQGGVSVMTRAELLPGFAWTLEQRYIRIRNLDDLEAAIEMARETLNVTIDFPEYRSIVLSSLARLLLLSWQHSGDAGSLDQSIDCGYQALSEGSPGLPTRLNVLQQLGISLFRRCRASKRADGRGHDDLDLAITVFREYLTLSSQSRHSYSLTSGLVAIFPFLRLAQGRSHETNDASWIASLQLPASKSIATVLSELGSAHFVRYWIQNRPEDEREGILCSDLALTMCAPNTPGRNLVLRNVAHIQLRRFERSDRREDVDKAIILFRTALDESLECITGISHLDCLVELASALGARFQRTGNLDDLNRSIRYGYEALAMCPARGVLRELTSSTLALSLAFRFLNSRQVQDWEEAKCHLEEALSLCPPGSLRKLTHITSISALYCWRVMLSEDRLTLANPKEYLDSALHFAQEAVEECPTSHLDKRLVLHNLGRCYRYRFSLSMTPALSDCDEAIKNFRSSLALIPDRSAAHLSLANDLVESLLMRYGKMQLMYNLEESIALGHQLLDQYADDKMHPERLRLLCNLASAVGLRAERTQSHEDRLLSINYAKDSALGQGGSSHRNHLNVAMLWAVLAREARHDSALHAYRTCLEVAERMFTVTPTLDMQHDIVRDLNSLALDAVSCAIDFGEPTLAVEMLEEGRTLLWSQIRRWRSPLDDITDSHHCELRDRFFDISRALLTVTTSSNPFLHPPSLNNDSDPYGRILERKRQLLSEYKDVVDQIRQLPALSGFLRLPSWQNLKRVSDEGPVIVVNHSKYRCDAIIIFPGGDIQCVKLKHEFYTRSIQMYESLVKARSCGVESKAYNKALGRVLEDVGELLVEPVLQVLKQNNVTKGSRIWWCPTSVVSSLPLHAARIGDTPRYLCDYYVSSYIPTLSALIDARSAVSAISPEDPRVLGVAVGVDTLKASKDEIAILQANFPHSDQLSLIVEERCTREIVLSHLQKSRWAHFICHGTMPEKPGEPLNASFRLWGDERLTLLDIIKSGLHDAELAVLSACHTAEQAQDSAAEEVLHLAAAMHFAGFRSVVGTMWAMRDEDGPVFAKRFYTKMLATSPDGHDQLSFKRAALSYHSGTVAVRKNSRSADLERWVNFVHIGA